MKKLVALLCALTLALALCLPAVGLAQEAPKTPKYVFLFIGAWATTKLPLLLFEAANLGTSYMLMRFAFNVVGIVLIAFLLEKSMTKDEVNELNRIVNSGGQAS